MYSRAKTLQASRFEAFTLLLPSACVTVFLLHAVFFPNPNHIGKMCHFVSDAAVHVISSPEIQYSSKNVAIQTLNPSVADKVSPAASWFISLRRLFSSGWRRSTKREPLLCSLAATS